MDEGTRRTLAFTVMVLFVMMIIGPIASLEAWLFGLIICTVLVPIIVILAMDRSKRKAEERKDLLTWRGYSAEEWKEDRDPDDFEGEID